MTKKVVNTDDIILILIKYCLGVFLKSLQTILASGVTLSLFAASAVIKTSAAAPSFSVLALAAVTVPNGGSR